MTPRASWPGVRDAACRRLAVLDLDRRVWAGVRPRGRTPALRLVVSWVLVSGPGAVSFADPGAAATSADFAVAGAYLLRLSATDGVLSGSDDLVVVVNPENQPPVVDAGPDRSGAVGLRVLLDGSVVDDGLPSFAFETQWSQVSGPGTALIDFPDHELTTALFDEPGVYVLRLTVSDTELAGEDETTVTIEPENQRPLVDAGADAVISLPAATLALAGAVDDDGLPSTGTLTTSWSSVAGPAAVVFDDSSALPKPRRPSTPRAATCCGWWPTTAS